jgi:hypothetical protein
MLSSLKEAVTGMEPTNEPRMLERPRAIISWLESTGFPFAATSRKVRGTGTQFFDKLRFSCFLVTDQCCRSGMFIPDVYPGSRIQIFSLTDPGSKRFRIGILIKN